MFAHGRILHVQNGRMERWLRLLRNPHSQTSLSRQQRVGPGNLRDPRNRGNRSNHQACFYTHPGGPWHALLLPGTLLLSFLCHKKNVLLISTSYIMFVLFI